MISISQTAKSFPGIIICGLLGAAAMWAASQFGAPVMLLAIILGLALHKLEGIEALKGGIQWASRGLLYIGVALLGLRIDLADLSLTGWLAPLLVILILLLTLGSGILIGKVLKQSGSFSVLMGGAVAICGISAAAAICAALEDCDSRNNELTITVAGITILSTMAMIIYPILAISFDFDALAAGMLMGGAIHNVSQAVGAGYAVSPEAGDIAVLLKLIRVLMLLPIVVLISLLSGKKAATPHATLGAKIRANFPPFLVVFFVLAMLSCLGLVPEPAAQIGNKFAHIALVVSLVAIGIKTNLLEVVKIGAKPLIAMTLTTMLMAGLIWLAIWIGL